MQQPGKSPFDLRNSLNNMNTEIANTQSVFEVLDYLSRWLHGKKKQLNSMNHHSYQSSRSHREANRDSLYEKYAAQIKSVEALLASIPPEIISKRAVECKSFSRALFHWEQYIRKYNSQAELQESSTSEQLYQRLQDIYSQIDEPDGIEGISSHLSALNIDQQVLEHRKAGRWATAQSWYELQLEKEPNDVEAQWNLVTCLKESGQQGRLGCSNALTSVLIFLRCHTHSLRGPQRQGSCNFPLFALCGGGVMDNRPMG